MRRRARRRAAGDAANGLPTARSGRLPAVQGAWATLSHTTPEEALRLFEDLGARRLPAIHWGTFDLAAEPIEEPPRRLDTEASRRDLGRARLDLQARRNPDLVTARTGILTGTQSGRSMVSSNRRARA